MSEALPWNRQEIFHDEIDRYPQFDYFPLSDEKKESETSAIIDKRPDI